MKIAFEIVTPSQSLATGQADEIVIPAAWGQMDILPQYADFVTTMLAGELIYRVGNERKSFAITGGLFTIAKDKATILVDGLLADKNALH